MEQIEIPPTRSSIARYLLWIEQQHQCLYCGQKIGVRRKQSAMTAIYRVEQGDWSMKRLEKIAGVFGIKISKLLEVK